MYKVYENGVPCSVLAAKMALKDRTWHTPAFEEKREAEIFAKLWAYPYTREMAEANITEMEIGKEYDMSMMGEGYVMMKIEKE